jgi:cytochrome P450
MSTDFVYDPSRLDFPERAHEIYSVLRESHPLYHNAEQGFWAVSRFEDVRSIASERDSLNACSIAYVGSD